jgi:hypothetical protein
MRVNQSFISRNFANKKNKSTVIPYKNVYRKSMQADNIFLLQDKTIPLAGFMSLFFAFVYGISLFFNAILYLPINIRNRGHP